MNLDYLYITDGAHSSLLELNALPTYGSSSWQTLIGDDTHGSWRPAILAKGKVDSKLLPGGGGIYVWTNFAGKRRLLLCYEYGGGKLRVGAALSPQDNDRLLPGQTGVGRLCVPDADWTDAILSPLAHYPQIYYRVEEKHVDPTKFWVGVGAKLTLQAPSLDRKNSRIELISGFLIKPFDLGQIAFIAAEAQNTSGGGVGGGVDAAVLIATGTSSPKDLLNMPTGGDDINVSFGANWTKVIKALSQASHYQKLLKALPTITMVKTMVAMDQLANLTIKNESWLVWAKTLTTASGVNTDERSLSVWDSPIAAGIELSCITTEGHVFWAADAFDPAVIRAKLKQYGVNM